MRLRVGLAVLGSTVIAPIGALAAEAPVAVSPGSPAEVLEVEARCPTFSWGSVPDAQSYELVIYRLEQRGREAEAVLHRSFAGSVTSWTPALGSCLERGSKYAWSVRAEGGSGDAEWSDARFFGISAGPSIDEVKEALELLRAYTGNGAAESGARDERGGVLPAKQPASRPEPLAPAARAETISPEDGLTSILVLESSGVRTDDATGAATDAVGVHGIVPPGDFVTLKIGVLGEVSGSNPESIVSFGVYGLTGSETGVGVRGDGYSTTGEPIGVQGIVNATNGYAGEFINHGGGVAVRAQGAIEFVATDTKPSCTQGRVYFDSSENWLCICDGVSFKRADNGAVCN